MARLIIGHTTDSSVRVWVRASARWPIAFLGIFNASGKTRLAHKPISTQESEFFTAVHDFTGLPADTELMVKVAFGKTLNDGPESWIQEAYGKGRFKTFPSTGGKAFSFMLGSCNLHSLGIFERPDQSWVSISRVAADTKARFMIHAGDQIYADIPFKPDASLEHYRDKYLDAWDDCMPARKVLTELPHYMILDDHEIINDYEWGRTDVGSTLPRIALKAYWEFQHSHNPTTLGTASQYYYAFNYGDVHFFVLDTRTARISNLNQMIDEPQMEALLTWLSKHKDAVKFVVTSVPFVGVVRDAGKDKWCSPNYKAQRERILSHVLAERVTHLTFLTGDMHTSYCAKMEVRDGQGNSAVIGELMSSPINQFTPSLPLRSHYESPSDGQGDNGLSYTSTIVEDSFYGAHSNVMSITVTASKAIRYDIYRTTSESSSAAVSGQL